LTKEGVQIDREELQEESKGLKSLLAEKMDSGADLLVVGTEQEDEQGLREVA
jgi:hypothetical protein